jgi:hypothetical protein
MIIEHYLDTQFIIGTNQNENDEIIKKYKKENTNYIWCHLQKSSSAHCIILSEKINKKHLQFAKQSIQKKNTNEKIIYTTLQNVNTTNQKGQVILNKFTIF